MLEKLQGIQVEPTNICTLKCPRCSRTKFIDQFPSKWKNEILNFDNLKKFLDIDLNGKIIGLNGNYGDPLYYPDLIPMVKYFKSSGCRLNIHTNGSYVRDSTWQQLSETLDETDVLTFSIDGIPSNFTNYRINADWNSIERGIKIITQGRAKTVWKFIVFSYNINDIETARQLSQDLGISEFVLNNSDRWDGTDDWLDPKTYINLNSESTNGILPIGSFDGNRTSSIVKWQKNIRYNDIDPLCKISNSLHHISAEGYYIPCCWAGDYRFYYQSEFYKHKDNYDISKTTLSQVLNNLETFFDTLETVKPKYCTFNCPKT